MGSVQRDRYATETVHRFEWRGIDGVQVVSSNSPLPVAVVPPALLADLVLWVDANRAQIDSMMRGLDREIDRAGVRFDGSYSSLFAQGEVVFDPLG